MRWAKKSGEGRNPRKEKKRKSNDMEWKFCITRTASRIAFSCILCFVLIYFLGSF